MCDSCGDLWRPGVLEMSARLCCPVKRLINEDLPTFDRPTTANSGYCSLGHDSTETALPTYSAVAIRIEPGDGK